MRVPIPVKRRGGAPIAVIVQITDGTHVAGGKAQVSVDKKARTDQETDVVFFEVIRHDAVHGAFVFPGFVAEEAPIGEAGIERDPPETVLVIVDKPVLVVPLHGHFDVVEGEREAEGVKAVFDEGALGTSLCKQDFHAARRALFKADNAPQARLQAQFVVASGQVAVDLGRRGTHDQSRAEAGFLAEQGPGTPAAAQQQHEK